MVRKKRLSEEARIQLVGKLDDDYKIQACCPEPDPGELYALGVRYMNAGMPMQGGRIMHEAWEIDRRKFVPNAVIIESTQPNSGYGGTNETTSLPVDIARRIAVDCLCAGS